MAAAEERREEDSSIQIGLLDASQNPTTSEEGHSELQLNQSLQRLENFLRFFGFCQYSPLSFTFSWLAFIIVGLLVPLVIIIEFSGDSDRYQIKSFELEILVFNSVAASISLLCISHNLRKYGLRKFLFVDRYQGHLSQFRPKYVERIHGFFRLLAIWMLPCFLLKTAREVVRVSYAGDVPWWQSVVILLALVISWTYSMIIYLSGSSLFNLVCNLQVIHFENYGKLLERDLDVSEYIEEHIRLVHYLSKISHRFRIFLLLEFLAVTATQILSLLETTSNTGIINFINGGDFAVSSIVQVVGLILCLHAAAKFSHRAQGLASVASRWHASVTCNFNEVSQWGVSNSNGNLDTANNVVDSFVKTNSESDLESDNYVPTPTNVPLASYMSSYHKRQAFVMYLQSNPRGVSIFGWTIDRALIVSIFFIELSLVSFVLGKTITITTK